MGVSEPHKPFLKWPGGKRWAAEQIAGIVREHLAADGTYFEPFLGGGAVYFFLQPPKARLGDLNRELIDTYRAVRDQPAEVRAAVRQLPLGSKAYQRIRMAEPRSSVSRAARFLYLNRTAFGGIYRVNKLGKFNVPFGGGERTPNILWETDILADAGKALRKASLCHSDFARLISRAGKGDVVYCDPTYTVAHDNNGFVRYNERNFSWLDQVRLAADARAASGRGATVVISNAHHQSIARLYATAEKHSLQRTSVVAAAPENRKAVREYLLVLPGKK